MKERGIILYIIMKEFWIVCANVCNLHNSWNHHLTGHTFHKLFPQYLFSISINLVIGHNLHYYFHLSGTRKKYLESICMIWMGENGNSYSLQGKALKWNFVFCRLLIQSKINPPLKSPFKVLLTPWKPTSWILNAILNSKK